MSQRAYLLLLGWLLITGYAIGAEVILEEGTNFALAVSPDGSQIVIDLQGTLWLLPAEGGDAEALTDGLGDDRLPDWAPDGSRILFQSFRNGSWDLWTISPDGSGLEPLTRSPYDDREPVWSPDGRRIAFASDRSDNYDLWILSTSDGQLNRITQDAADDTMPCWSPDGLSLAFISERGDEGETELWKIDIESGRESKVAEFGGKAASPSWSRDGTRIAIRLVHYLPLTLMGSRFDEGMTSELILVPVDGSETMRLPAGDDVFPFRPAWTEEGEIVYSADGEIRRLAIETKEREDIPFRAAVHLEGPSYRRREARLTEPDEVSPVRGIVRPVVSPDGTHIAFTALGDIWMAPSGGGTPKPLTRDEYLDSDPSWSPDGKRVVFASDRDGSMDLWVKDIGSSLQSGAIKRTADVGEELTPSWSPDGKWIAYLDEQSDVHIVDAEGGGASRRICETKGASIPSWSSDSRHLAFAVLEPFSGRYREGFNRIKVISIETEEETVLPVPEKNFGTRDGDGPVWSPDGTAMAFAMDGGIWILPVTPSGEPTAEPRKVIDEPGDFLAWWPDSKRLLYLSSEGVKQADLMTGRPETVSLPLNYRAASAGGALLIKGAKLIDGTGAAPRENVDIFVEGNRVQSIEPARDEIPEDARVIDATGKTVIPGLIDAHTHLGLPAWGSRHGRVWLAYGVTSIRTMADPIFRVLEERESITSGRRVGPRIFTAGFALDGDRVYYNGYLSVEDDAELRVELDRILDLEIDLVKTYVRLTDARQKLVVEEAHRRGVYVTSHEVYPAVAFGIDGIEHIRGTSRRGFSPKVTDLRRTYRDVRDLIVQSGVYFTPTLLIQGGFRLAVAREPQILEEPRLVALYPEWARAWFSSPRVGSVAERAEVMGPLFETIDAVARSGGNVLAGTDSPIVPYGLSLILEIEMLSEAGLGPLGAIQSATRLAAEALGAEKDLGTVEPGKIADLVILSEDPTVDVRNLRTTEHVIQNGRLLTVSHLLDQRLEK
jgi:Tol biopolymer transport system component/imidazolonepropionase-like amidohydrolase